MYLATSIMYQALRIKYLKKIFLLFILATCYMLRNTATPARAQTMSNDNYIIQMQGFNAISGVSSGKDYEVRSTVGDISPIVSEGVNYKVKTGFENLIAVLPFSILLSSSTIDFGILSPTNPIIRTLDLTINSQSAYGYSVLVSENESLTTFSSLDNKTFIPDTTCDNGQCNAESASEWTNALTYGFGYRCDNVTGVDCDNSFAKTNSYKHFPNIANNDIPIPVMAGIGSKNKSSRISYKINISVNQSQDIYSNIITYIGVPNF